MRFPGLRGRASQANFLIHPLSFYDVMKITGEIKQLDKVLQLDEPTETSAKQCEQAFQKYLLHGGYLTAINNYAEQGQIDKAGPNFRSALN